MTNAMPATSTNVGTRPQLVPARTHGDIAGSLDGFEATVVNAIRYDAYAVANPRPAPAVGSGSGPHVKGSGCEHVWHPRAQILSGAP